MFKIHRLGRLEDAGGNHHHDDPPQKKEPRSPTAELTPPPPSLLSRVSTPALLCVPSSPKLPTVPIGKLGAKVAEVTGKLAEPRASVPMALMAKLALPTGKLAVPRSRGLSGLGLLRLSPSDEGGRGGSIRAEDMPGSMGSPVSEKILRGRPWDGSFGQSVEPNRYIYIYMPVS